MQQPFCCQRLDGAAVAEGARQADVRPFEQRGPTSLVERQELPHLTVQPRIGEGVRRELVAQEAPNDVLGVGDGVQGHGYAGRYPIPHTRRRSRHPCSNVPLKLMI